MMNCTALPTNSMFRRLHTASRDVLSTKSLFELQTMAGEKATKLVAETFPGKKDRNKHHRAQALRWMLRGLAMDLSVQKVKFDIWNKKQVSCSSSGNANKSTNKMSQSRKKTGPSGGGSKYYLNRRTFAF